MHGELRFRSVPPLLVPLRDAFNKDDPRDQAEYVQELMAAMPTASTRTADTCSGRTGSWTWPARWLGVGSVGTRATVFLLVGRDGKDPLVLQAKEAQASVLEPHLGASEFENHGERVVRGQRISHAASDIFLSWTRSMDLDGKERDFYVRQLWHWKASMDLSTMSESGLHAYSRACGWSLARGARPLRRPARHRRSPWRGRQLR